MSDRERSTRVRASLVRITRTGTSTRTAVSVNAALQIVTNNRMYTKMYGPDSRHDGRRAGGPTVWNSLSDELCAC